MTELCNGSLMLPSEVAAVKVLKLLYRNGNRSPSLKSIYCMKKLKNNQLFLHDMMAWGIFWFEAGWLDT